MKILAITQQDHIVTDNQVIVNILASSIQNKSKSINQVNLIAKHSQPSFVSNIDHDLDAINSFLFKNSLSSTKTSGAGPNNIPLILICTKRNFPKM